jgi:hypothetical protein
LTAAADRARPPDQNTDQPIREMLGLCLFISGLLILAIPAGMLTRSGAEPRKPLELKTA